MIVEIVDAFISKSNLSKTYSNTLDPTGEDIPNVNVNADFTNSSGKFICYLAGHDHQDNFGTVRSAKNKQICLVSTTSNCDPYNPTSDDILRVEGTRSEDCFNVFSFDTTRREIRIMRIGTNVTCDLKRRDYATIKY